MINKTLVTSLAFLMASCLAVKSIAQTKIDSITPQSKKLITSTLKTGLKQYLVYMQSPSKNKSLLITYWVRNIVADERNGEKVIITTQHWYGNDTLNYRTVYSVNRKADFAPLYHSETVKGHHKSYNWANDKITGADTVAINEAKTFNLTLQYPVFNWNLDIETFEQLPLAAGKTFAINFYDANAGTVKPEYILYKVTGSEKLQLLNNISVDCWKLLTEGKAPNGAIYTQTFWISKQEHEFLKEEDTFGGNTRIKIKLPGAAPDVVARFK